MNFGNNKMLARLANTRKKILEGQDKVKNIGSIDNLKKLRSISPDVFYLALKNMDERLNSYEDALTHNDFLRRLVELYDSEDKIDKAKSKFLQNASRKISRIKDENERSKLEALATKHVDKINNLEEITSENAFLGGCDEKDLTEFMDNIQDELNDPVNANSPANEDPVAEGNYGPTLGYEGFQDFDPSRGWHPKEAYPNFWQDFKNNALNGTPKIGFSHEARKAIYDGGDIV